MRTVRSAIRALGALTAVFLALPGLALAVPSAQAATGKMAHPSARTSAADTPPLAISITGMTPSYATPGATVTVAGTIANHTGSAVSGIDVQAQTSGNLFNARAEMTTFAATGSYPYGVGPAGPPEVTGTIQPGATLRWSVSFSAAVYDQFGVYPVEVSATAATGFTVNARTFLPYWSGASAATRPKPLQVAWIWPLVDTPQQGACAQTLATNDLASSIAGDGRLSTLLAAGSAYSQADDLTWDIDPALLSDVSVMKSKYHTLGNATCSGRFQQRPDKAAGEWLTRLATATSGQSVFLTPYANVDAAALSHAGLDQSLLRSAYQLGETTAGQLMPGTFGVNGTGTGEATVLKAAWPAGGQADAGVVTSLATNGGISTVVLRSGEVPPSTPGYDNAVARPVVDDIGTSVSVLLADSELTGLVGSASSRPTESGLFALTQDFLAQTAMISSEAPATARSLVVAPPTGWQPSAAEASALLRITQGGHDAPWLHPAGLSALSAQAAKLSPAPAASLPAKQVNPEELPADYLDAVKKVNSDVALYTDLLFQPSSQVVNSLRAAVAATASSAWRGSGLSGGWLAISKLDSYVSKSERNVFIVSSKKILLAGDSGETPVSVRNLLKVPVQVRVTAVAPPGSQIRLGPIVKLLKVQGGKTGTVRMPVHAATIGTTTVQLQLVTQNGSPMTWTGQSLSVEVTRFGRFLLLIIGGALGILVLTTVYRLRRKRLASSRPQDSTPDRVDAGGAG